METSWRDGGIQWLHVASLTNLLNQTIIPNLVSPLYSFEVT
uniref:Uncharacterized protein n=1 Tax=Arundo donax TaxID=35708 RepID=A0A0A9A375_ARUDO